MKLLSFLLGVQQKSEMLFDNTQGKTLAEYQRELLIKAGKVQFEKLKDLGLAIPVQLA